MDYTVAIVEDDREEGEALCACFRQYAREHGDTFRLERFEDGGKFLDGYQPIYDLVMMDINLPGINGMDVAAELRRLDQSVALIFVTSLARYAVRGYEVDAIDFLVKPVSYQSFSVKLQRAIRRCRRNYAPELLISTADGLYRISAARVKYIEVINHSLVYHTTEGIIESTGKLKDLEERLNGGCFIRCNRCYLVNMSFVRAVRGSSLVVDSDELQISRPKYKAVLEALNNHLAGGG